MNLDVVQYFNDRLTVKNGTFGIKLSNILLNLVFRNKLTKKCICKQKIYQISDGKLRLQFRASALPKKKGTPIRLKNSGHRV